MVFTEEKTIDNQNKIEKNILQSVKNIFSPELLNRLDEVIVFNSLTKKDIYEIIDMQLDDLYSNLLDLGINIRVYKTAKNLIWKKVIILIMV